MRIVRESPPPFMDRSMFELSIPLNFAEFRECILHTFEFKWNGKARNNHPRSFANSYPNSTYSRKLLVVLEIGKN